MPKIPIILPNVSEDVIDAVPSQSSSVGNVNTNGQHATNGHTSYHHDGVTATARLWKLHDTPVENQRPIKVIVIGCGFSGVYCGIRIPEKLRNCELTIYEKNAGIGGTWWENRYPGAACDVPSHSYQYSFNPKHDWSSLYAGSQEIREYIISTASKYGADRFVKLEHEVTGATWHQESGKWKVQVRRPDGSIIEDTSEVLIPARGLLNRIMWPDIPGLRDFKGPVMHSAAWDETYDFSGKRIGLIGSGSSAIQILPQLQKLNGTRISAFMRGRTWISPPLAQAIQDRMGFEGFAIPPDLKDKLKTDKEAWDQFRLEVESENNNAHAMMIKDTPMQLEAREAFETGMKARLSKKPEYYDMLTPTFSPGCRRLTPGPGFLEALVEDNVQYIKTPIASVQPSGVVTEGGNLHEIDVLVCATGFYASAAPAFPIVGENGRTLVEHWQDRATSYMSLATDKFPNMFMMLGPNSAVGEGALTMILESMGDYIIKAIRKLQKENIKSMVVKPERVRDFCAYSDAQFEKTVYSETCRSWYKKDGQGRYSSKVTGLWPGSTLHAIEALRSPRWEDYEYEYIPETNGAPVNQLAWMGNGWAGTQLGKDPRKESLAFYVVPEFQERDIGQPTYPRPEENEHFQIRPWSY